MSVSISSSWVNVTPRIAASMLEESGKAGVKNRRLRATVVAKYASDMLSKRWQENGQPIVVNGTGAVLDGQHRLHAIIQSGVTCRILVIRGVDQAAIDTIDTGVSRKTGDVLTMHGYTNPLQVAATANLLYLLLNGMTLRGGFSVMSTVQTIRFVEEHKEILEAIPIVVKCGVATNRGTPITISSAAFMYCAVEEAVRPDMAEFLRQVSIGENIKRGDPAFAFRRAVMQIQGNRSFHRIVKLAMFIKAWNAYINAETLDLCRHRSSEKFPEIDSVRKDAKRP